MNKTFELMAQSMADLDRARANVLNAAYGNSVYGIKGDRDFSHVSLHQMMANVREERQALRKALDLLLDLQNGKRYATLYATYSHLLENSNDLKAAIQDAVTEMNSTTRQLMTKLDEFTSRGFASFGFGETLRKFPDRVYPSFDLLNEVYVFYVGLCKLSATVVEPAPKPCAEHYLGWPETHTFPRYEPKPKPELPMDLGKCLHFAASCYTMAACSKSKRRACGSLLVRVQENGVPVIVSSGVNGTDAGADNACEPQDLTYTYSHVRHAEDACLNAMSEPHHFDNSYVLFVTDSPCENCFKLIKERHIKHVVYSRGYRIQDHLDDSLNLVQVPLEEVEAYIKLSIERMHKVIC